MTNTYGHSSNPRDLTLDKCVPKFLWIPEHSIHISVPKFKLAHSGAEIHKQCSYLQFFQLSDRLNSVLRHIQHYFCRITATAPLFQAGLF